MAVADAYAPAVSLPPLAGRRIVIVGSAGAGKVDQMHGCSDFVEYVGPTAV